MSLSSLSSSYNYPEDILRILLGKLIYDGQVASDVDISVPVSMTTRHGLITGATGSGKTKSMQLYIEGLSRAGISSLVLDIKGDVSGLAMPGVANDKISARNQKLGIDYISEGFPVELWTVSDDSSGTRIRSSVTEFGPVLMSKILSLSPVQLEVMDVIFKFCDDYKLPIVDLQDLSTVLRYISSDQGQGFFISKYGNISSSTISSIHRSIIALEGQGAGDIFAEPSLDVGDLVRQDSDGRGYINILRVSDIPDKPQLFVTTMLGTLAEIYESFPEIGDKNGAKLCIFLDEAHLIFQDAHDTLIDQLTMIIKLIRSKGVGVYFCTQVPDDIPSEILSQLGLKIQHVLRGVTARDQKSISQAIQNFPISQDYDLEELISSLAIGEAMVTTLDPSGKPTPIAYTMMLTPSSRMDILTTGELSDIVCKSDIYSKYKNIQDNLTAHEILSQKMGIDISDAEISNHEDLPSKSSENDSGSSGFWGSISSDNVLFQRGQKIATSMAKNVGNKVVRGALGKLGIKIDGRTRFF